jgi:competence protein ComEA
VSRPQTALPPPVVLDRPVYLDPLPNPEQPLPLHGTDAQKPAARGLFYGAGMDGESRLAAMLGGDRRRLTVGAVLVLVLVAVAVAVLLSATASVRPATVVPVLPPSPAAASGDLLLVHVLGAVRRPGLYSLPAGARVVDALAAAGGLADGADAAGVNLARRIADGEQLRVPVVGEVAAPSSEPERVDLNTATEEQLATLPRIGPALAARIVQWREDHGPFSSADDLLDVSGLGQKTVDGLRDLVLP